MCFSLTVNYNDHWLKILVLIHPSDIIVITGNSLWYSLREIVLVI